MGINMLISFLRTIIIYVIIIAAVRIMGKRQISQLQTTELVVTLLIADLAVIPMQDSGQPLTNGLIPIFVLIGLELIMSVIMLKNSKFRRAICGKPIVVIADGKVQQDEMRELRISTEDLFEQLRQKDVFSIKDVKYAIVETNGTMSVMKEEACETVRLKDMGIKANEEGIETVVVSDGELCPNSLTLCKKDSDWVKKTLASESTELSQVFIMTANTAGKYTVIKKEKGR